MSSAKRPLEDPSSPSAPTDLPEAKRPALDKLVKEEAVDGSASPASAAAPVPGEGNNGTAEPALPTSVANGSTESHSEATAPADTDKTTTLPSPDVPVLSSSTAQDDRAGSQAPSIATQDETNWIHIRAVISSAEAATCIGKGGENVTQIRKLSGAKCTVSDYSRGAVERILTVSGAQDAVAKVC